MKDTASRCADWRCELTNDLRERSLGLFRDGTAKVIVSAKSLIEGFNVPEADLGIIVASSSSPRQRIQSIGRVLRRYRGPSGEQKSSRVCVLFVRDTVDEAIYERENWDELIGLDRNRYFDWDLPASPLEQSGPPRRAIPSESDIDITALIPGEEYPGRYDGHEFSTDTLGNVLDPDGRIARNPQNAPALVTLYKGSRGGRFKVTPRERAVLILLPLQDGGWKTVFAGMLKEPFLFDEPQALEEFEVSELAPGDTYLGPVAPADEYRYRQRSGGLIAMRIPGGELFARGPEADRVVGTLRELTRSRGPLAKIFINDLNHVFWREQGEARFIVALSQPLAFPEGR